MASGRVCACACTVIGLLLAPAHALTLGPMGAATLTAGAARPSPPLTASRASAEVRMMFGGGAEGEGNWMDKLKAAKDMFNPEMMKKYSEVGVKVQALQEELTQTEVECATNEGGIVVKVTGTQVPLSVEISDEMCAGGAEKLSEELAAALKQAHAKSGAYAQQKMAELYEEMGLSSAAGAAPPKQ